MREAASAGVSGVPAAATSPRAGRRHIRIMWDGRAVPPLVPLKQGRLPGPARSLGNAPCHMADKWHDGERKHGKEAGKRGHATDKPGYRGDRGCCDPNRRHDCGIAGLPGSRRALAVPWNRAAPRPRWAKRPLSRPAPGPPCGDPIPTCGGLVEARPTAPSFPARPGPRRPPRPETPPPRRRRQRGPRARRGARDSPRGGRRPAAWPAARACRRGSRIPCQGRAARRSPRSGGPVPRDPARRGRDDPPLLKEADKTGRPWEARLAPSAQLDCLPPPLLAF